MNLERTLRGIKQRCELGLKAHLALNVSFH